MRSQTTNPLHSAGNSTPAPSSAEVRICVIIPVYNHCLTLQEVIRGAQREFPVVVVDDGSTDRTPAILASQTGITVLTLPQNQGKAAALQAGFAKAESLGFTHATTIDADGQHPTDALAGFAATCRAHPEAFIIGVRDFKLARAPMIRRASNALSNFWFRFQTGVGLKDTQCGYRVYPLRPIRELQVSSDRYAYELEVMVKAAWAGIPLKPHSVLADYTAPTSRLSHFRPLRDFLRLSRVHSRLSMQAFCIPGALRALRARREWHEQPRGRRFRAVLRHLFSEHTQSRGRLAGAVGLGLFCGIAPIWGFQMMVAALLAHKLRLNKAVALSASNISVPLIAPFIFAAALILGHLLVTGQWLRFEAGMAARQIPAYVGEWLLGSVVLAFLVGALGALLTLLTAAIFDYARKPITCSAPPPNPTTDG